MRAAEAGRLTGIVMGEVVEEQGDLEVLDYRRKVKQTATIRISLDFTSITSDNNFDVWKGELCVISSIFFIKSRLLTPRRKKYPVPRAIKG